MADAVIGALRVTLGADTAKFEDGLKKGESALRSFAANIATIAAGIGLERIIEKSVAAAVHAVKEGFERIDKIGKEAEKAGIGVEVLSGLSLSAELADVSLEQLAQSLGRLSKNMVQTAQGTGEATKTFEALGVTVTNADGTLKSSSQVLTEVADKFANTGDSATKTAAAIALFGKSGAQLIPLLNEGAAGLEEMRQTAQNLGLIIEKNTANQVEKFNDNLKILGKTGEGITNLVIKELIPGLLALSEIFVENARTGDFVRMAANAIIGEFQALTVAINQSIVGVSLLLSAWIELKNIFASFPNIEASAQAFNNLREILTQWNAAMTAAKTTAMEWFNQTLVDGKAKTEQIEVATSKYKDTIANFTLQAAVARNEFALLAQGFAQQAATLGLTDKAAIGLSRTVEGLTPRQRELNDAMLQFQGAKIAQEALPPWQLYEQQLQRIQVAFNAGALSADEAAAAMRKAAESTGQAWDIASNQIVTSLASGLKAFSTQNTQLSAAAKAAAIVQATINTYTAATKALATYPPPLSYIAAGAALVAGLGYVAQIKAQNFATGGSFRVGGGLTGMDSEMVAFRATPGELVDVRRPGTTAAPAQTINLQMPQPQEFFSIHVREMVKALNRAAPDGYILKVAS